MKYTVRVQSVKEATDHMVQVEAGTPLSAAISAAGIEINEPCGGQGRCGRCAVKILQGRVHSPETSPILNEDGEDGFVLACQAQVESDLTLAIPEGKKFERVLPADRLSPEITIPAGYSFSHSQPIRRYNLSLTTPSLEEQINDWSRLQLALSRESGILQYSCSLETLRQLGTILRESNWQVHVLVELNDATQPTAARILDILPGLADPADPVWGCAVDIGTTTVTLWLVNLVTGKVASQAVEYNRQILRGEDVISRIVFTQKNGPDEMQERIIDTINDLCKIACQRVGTYPQKIMKTTIAGNPTMIHLLLGVPANSLRLSPYIPAFNQFSGISAKELGFVFHPNASLDILPGVSSFIGGDITAGVLSSTLADQSALSLFIDIGTNGEIVLGNQDWLVSCACSAGPAFEGAGVGDGMRATAGAIDEVWIHPGTYEPTLHVIGDLPPRGICGSGLISLIAELFIHGLIDKGGNFNFDAPCSRIRKTDQGGEFVFARSHENATSHDLILSRVDIDNLLRAKAAIYAGFVVLLNKVGLSMQDIDRMLIGGSFGKYINLEKAVQIGLLPDLNESKFKYLGNTSISGAYLALLDSQKRKNLNSIAEKCAYIELSADNQFYEEFTSALFLPHTNISRFPNVLDTISEIQASRVNSPLPDETRPVIL